MEADSDGYEKYKIIVKKWEKNFKKLQHRNPTKMDIKMAPENVRKAYRLYWVLKTSVLESFISCDGDVINNPVKLVPITSPNKSNECKVSDNSFNGKPDEINCYTVGIKCDSTEHENTRFEDNLSFTINKCIQDNNKNGSCLNVANLKNVVCDSIDNKLPIEITSTNNTSSISNKTTVWSNYLNKPKVKQKKIYRSFSSQFAEKLFKGASFNKRNPRRSHSYNSIKLTNTGLAINEENSQSSISSYDSAMDSNNSNSCSLDIVDDINVLTTGEILNSSNMPKVTVCKPSINAYPLSMIEKKLNDDAKHGIKSKSFNAGWLERCNVKCLYGTDVPDLVISDVKTDLELQIANVVVESDDELIYNSDNENSNMSNFEFRNILNQNNSLTDTNIEHKSMYVKNDQEENGIECDEPVSNHMIYNSVSDTIKENLYDAANVELHRLSSLEIKESVLPAVKRLQSKSLEGNRLKKKKINPKKSLSDQKLNSKLENRRKLLENKVTSGKANENFLKINLKKKVFVRGKKTMTLSKYKKQQWKLKKQFLNQDRGYSSFESKVVKCFRCGDVGHFSKNCHQKGNCLLPNDNDDDEVDDSPFPTLEEVADMAKTKTQSTTISADLETAIQVDSKSHNLIEDTNNLSEFEPLYTPNADGSIIDTPYEVHEALLKFGHGKFRYGQEEAIMNILSGKSTLIVQSTGFGKSLCYQIPAYIYSKHRTCITLVISPLVSLMEDQIIGIPSVLNAACLHTNQTAKQREIIVENIKKGEISVLLISPEAIVSGERGCFGYSIIKSLPPIAFACIDEVHCVSQWSHNFRPSYLMICRVLRERFNVRTFLGLTATATKATIASVTEHLLDRQNRCDVIQSNTLPENLLLSVSKDENRDEGLISLLTSSLLNECTSIIIYCIRRNECERLAVYIRTRLQDIKKLQNGKKRSRISLEAEAYHAGLSSNRRKQVQKAFMSGNLRIVVATVAFGMGINKHDIRAVIHYNMPRTFEHYVQEIGRAGRDGLLAYCHLFIDSQGNDLCELGRHIYGDSMDRFTVRKLLQRVFPKCKCTDVCKKHEVAFPIEDTVKILDLPQENISTLLCYLELHPKRWIHVLQPGYIMCNIQAYSGILALKRAAKSCSPLAAAIALEERKNSCPFKSNKLTFSVIDVANHLQWDSGIVKHHLKNCEWTKDNGKSRKTGILVEFFSLGFRVLSPGNLNFDELDEALDVLYGRIKSQESASVLQLQVALDAFNSIVYPDVEASIRENDKTRSDNLKFKITEYFKDEKQLSADNDMQNELKDETQLICDIHRLVSAYKDVNFTGRVIARIFHGIESPNFPALIWGRSPFWRIHIKEDFNALCSFATGELIKLR